MSEPTFTLTEAIALQLWRSALSQELGLRVPIDREDFKKVQDTFYKARQNAGDASLNDLLLVTAPGGNEIWIMKKSAELP